MSGEIEVDGEEWCELHEELDRLRIEKEADRQAIDRLAAENERLRKVLEEAISPMQLMFQRMPESDQRYLSQAHENMLRDIRRALNRPECLEQPKESEHGH